MESYDVIANQPVVIDNVSAGGRASRERGGPAIPLSSGRLRPARRPPHLGRLGRRLRPSHGAIRRPRGAGPLRLGESRLAGASGSHPRRGRCPALGGAAPTAAELPLVGRGGALPLAERAVSQRRSPQLPAGAGRDCRQSTRAHWQLALSVGRGFPGPAHPSLCLGDNGGAGPGRGRTASVLRGRPWPGLQRAPASPCLDPSKLWGCWRFPGPMEDMMLCSRAPLAGPAREKP